MSSDDEIIEKVMEKIDTFYFGDGEGEKAFSDFAAKHSALFDEMCSATESENKLEYTAVYNEFVTMFEGKVEQMVKECDTTVEEFYGALKRASEKGTEGQFYVELILAVTEYENFVEMMRDWKARQAK